LNKHEAVFAVSAGILVRLHKAVQNLGLALINSGSKAHLTKLSVVIGPLKELKKPGPWPSEAAMRGFTFLMLGAVAAIGFTATTPKAEAQVNIAIGVAPDCAYGTMTPLLMAVPLLVTMVQNGLTGTAHWRWPVVSWRRRLPGQRK
jgi:hypothetical protein